MTQKIELRDYQQVAVGAGIRAIRDGTHGLIVLPTGSGKSLVAAAILQQAMCDGKRGLLLSHRKELLVQDEKALKMLMPNYEAGVYCAGLDRKEPERDIVFASIGSVYRKPEVLGERHIVLVDECHLVPRDGRTMYGRVFGGHFSEATRIGLSATPYRLDSGSLTDGPDALFDETLIQIPAMDLVRDGYLSPLVGVHEAEGSIDTQGIHKRAGEFAQNELEQVAVDDELIKDAVGNIVRHAPERRGHLVFCVSVDHTKLVAQEMTRQGIKTKAVWGNMPSDDRLAALDDFQNEAIDGLANCQLLTTGIDLPRIDCISIMAPTLSKAKHVQSLGRGMRKHAFKENCKVLDFGGNCLRHGDIDELPMTQFYNVPLERAKKRRKQQLEAEAKEPREITHDKTAALGVDPMAGGNVIDLPVERIKYAVVNARQRPGTRNLLVTYHTEETTYCTSIAGGMVVDFPSMKIRRWVCVEYSGAARFFAERFFAARGIQGRDVPRTAMQARALARQCEEPTAISVTKNASGFYDIRLEHFEMQEDTNGVD